MYEFGSSSLSSENSLLNSCSSDVLSNSVRQQRHVNARKNIFNRVATSSLMERLNLLSKSMFVYSLYTVKLNLNGISMFGLKFSPNSHIDLIDHLIENKKWAQKFQISLWQARQEQERRTLRKKSQKFMEWTSSRWVEWCRSTSLPADMMRWDECQQEIFKLFLSCMTNLLILSNSN